MPSVTRAVPGARLSPARSRRRRFFPSETSGCHQKDGASGNQRRRSSGPVCPAPAGAGAKKHSARYDSGQACGFLRHRAGRPAPSASSYSWLRIRLIFPPSSIIASSNSDRSGRITYSVPCVRFLTVTVSCFTCSGACSITSSSPCAIAS